MFCPQCSNEILSERARFCTRCSFPLTTVKELVVAEAAKRQDDEGKKNYPLRQQDISLGAGLMIIGLISAIAAVVGIGLTKELEGLLLTIDISFVAILMFSQFSPRQRGLTVGAMTIFLGWLIGVAVGFAS